MSSAYPLDFRQIFWPFLFLKVGFWPNIFDHGRFKKFAKNRFGQKKWAFGHFWPEKVGRKNGDFGGIFITIVIFWGVFGPFYYYSNIFLRFWSKTHFFSL
jgi:hypothetical protein